MSVSHVPRTNLHYGLECYVEEPDYVESFTRRPFKVSYDDDVLEFLSLEGRLAVGVQGFYRFRC